jgi:hypothetical protein
MRSRVMDEISQTLTAFLATNEGLAIKGLMVGAFLVFALGVVAALRDHTFDFRYIDMFVRTTVLGKVVPVAIILVVGYMANEQLLTLGGIAAAGTVYAAMIKSGLDSIQQLTLPPADSARLNTPPS